MRQTWDETWISMARVIARRSSCVNRQVGAMIVDKHNRPISAGYNGAPAGFGSTSSMKAIRDTEDCRSFCPRSSGERSESYDNCVSVHAELNALMFSDRKDYFGGTIYVTSPCCFNCAKAVANSGVERVVCEISEKDGHIDNQRGIEFLRSCGIEVEVLQN
jgi:dCMP deaminase